MKVLNKYIEKKMLLNFNKILVTIKVYLIKNLQFDFIIDMNVLNKSDIDFMLNRKSLKVKNIDILLCYAFSSSSKKINYYFYHFMTYTNKRNIIFLYIRKWKSFSNFINRSISLLISINKKSNRSFNFATLSFSYEFFTNRFFIFVLHMKITLVFNKKFVDLKFICQSTKIEINSFENKNVAFFNFFRKCRHCKQFFIFEIFFINIFHPVTKISKNSSMHI